MGDSDIGLEIERGIAHITFDRPERRNALTQQMWHRLIEFADRLAHDGSSRLVVFRSSTPGIFSSGADITEYREHAADLDWGEESQRVVAQALRAVEAIPMPTLAAIDGPCFGGGCGIAVACDWRIATSRSTFGITPAKLGMVYPFTATVTLVDRVGNSAAMWLLATGGTADSDHALRMRLVDRVIENPELLAEVVEEYAALLRATSPASVRVMKESIARMARGQRQPTAETDGWVRQALESADYHEGVSAFLERRQPRFAAEPD